MTTTSAQPRRTRIGTRCAAPAGRLTSVGPPTAVNRRETELHGQTVSFLEPRRRQRRSDGRAAARAASGSHMWEAVLLRLGSKPT